MRVPGVAVFLSPSGDTTPLALRAHVEHSHVLHQRVVIVSVDTVSIPNVESADRFGVKHVGRGRYRISHVTIRNGYHDRLSVPEALRSPQAGAARTQPRPRARLVLRLEDHDHADRAPGMSVWRKKLFIMMARNAASPIDHFGLPGDRTVIMGSQVAF